MDQVTRTRKFLKKEEWKTLILECQSSGMTVASWCATNNVCQQTYYRNLQKLRAELCESFPIPVPAVLPEKPIEFKKLEVLTSIPNIQAVYWYTKFVTHRTINMIYNNIYYPRRTE